MNSVVHQCRPNARPAWRVVAFLWSGALGLVWWASPCEEGRLGAQPIPNRTAFQVQPAMLPEASSAVKAHLDRADALLADGQWDEAAEAVRQAMSGDGDRLLRSDGAAFPVWLPVRDVCQAKLASWHRAAPEALRRYRQRVDGVAKKLFQDGRDQGDERVLVQVLDQFAASSVGDDALSLLGDLAISRGVPTRARSFWERLSPANRTQVSNAGMLGVPVGYPLGPLLRGVDLTSIWGELGPTVETQDSPPLGPNFPDPQFSPGTVQTRLILVSLLEGDSARAEAERQILRQAYSDERGRLAGREGQLGELVGKLVEDAAEWPARRPAPDWRTFAGAFSRQHVVPQPGDWEGRRWSTDPRPFAERVPQGAEPRIEWPAHADSELLQPLIADGQLYVARGRRLDEIQAFDLKTGRRVWSGPGATVSDEPPQVEPMVTRSPPFGLSLDNHLLYACVSDEASDDRLTRLVALDTTAQGRLRFEIRLEEPAWRGDWEFAGPPMTVGSRVHVALQRTEGVRSEIYLAAFDGERGRLEWNRQVVIGGDVSSGPNRRLDPELLLTGHDDALFLNSHRGVIASLRSTDGRWNWLVEYPRLAMIGSLEAPAAPLTRHRTPCLAFRDLVICAPADSDRLFALDYATGKLRWTTPPEQAGDVRHLLGVADETLVASGEFLYWFDVNTGDLVWQFPEPRKTGPGLARPQPHGHGRGLLSREEVWWPTSQGLYIFDAKVPDRRGAQPRLRRLIDGLTQGFFGANLVYGDDAWAWADSKSVTVSLPHPETPHE